MSAAKRLLELHALVEHVSHTGQLDGNDWYSEADLVPTSEQ
jgi:hypothetical protein